MTYQPAFQAFFHSGGMDGDLVCPECKDTLLHPTGHSRVDNVEDDRPAVSIVARCECGAVVEILIGNHEGNLAAAVRSLAIGPVVVYGEDPTSLEGAPGEAGLLDS